uniref:Uncharacterized protein n=1 Tax=Panagrolaimus sp. ES5 TaxID=591445 RepID=A0AC34FFJ1_9BILA
MQRSLLFVALCCFAFLIQTEGLKKAPVEVKGDNDDPETKLSKKEKSPKHDKKNVNVTRNVYIIDENQPDGGGSNNM